MSQKPQLFSLCCKLNLPNHSILQNIKTGLIGWKKLILDTFNAKNDNTKNNAKKNNNKNQTLKERAA